MRDLLDEHPAISMLPSEGTFFTNFEPRLRRLPRDAWLPSMGREWLRRLANPVNQPPYWLRGRSSAEGSPYVTFACSLIAWWPVASRRLGRTVSSWPLAAIALAFAHCTGALSETSRVTRWGEKTPLNERFLPRLLSEFPHAQIVQLVRHPASVYASRKALEPALNKSLRSRRGVLKELLLSYQIAAERSGERVAGRFKVIRYEDLIADPRATMEQLAHFLGIERVAGLLKPTVAGALSRMNSSFERNAAPGRVHSSPAQPEALIARREALSAADGDLLAATMGDMATALGYTLTPLAPWRARLVRLKLLL
jgi:hypothetical protein